MRPVKSAFLCLIVLSFSALAGELLRESWRASLVGAILLSSAAGVFLLLIALLIAEVWRTQRYVRRINRAAFLLTRIKAGIAAHRD